MAKQAVGIGTVANDGTGDPLRTAFTKINANFDELYGGTSFPVAPASGDRYYRSDRNIQYFYDGTRWLSTTLYAMPISMGLGTFPMIATTSLQAPQPFGGVYDIWLETIELQVLCSAAPASNYFTYQFSKSTAAAAPVNIGSGFSSQNITINSFTRFSETIGAVVASTVNNIRVACTRVSSGSDYPLAQIKYRLVG